MEEDDNTALYKENLEIKAMKAKNLAIMNGHPSNIQPRRIAPIQGLAKARFGRSPLQDQAKVKVDVKVNFEKTCMSKHKF